MQDRAEYPSACCDDPLMELAETMTGRVMVRAGRAKGLFEWEMGLFEWEKVWVGSWVYWGELVVVYRAVRDGTVVPVRLEVCVLVGTLLS